MNVIFLCLSCSRGLTISLRRRSFSRSWWRPTSSQTWQKGSDRPSVEASKTEQELEDAGKFGEPWGVRLQVETRGTWYNEKRAYVPSDRKASSDLDSVLNIWRDQLFHIVPLFHIDPRVRFEARVIKNPRGGEQKMRLTQKLDWLCQTYLFGGERSPLQPECIHCVDSTSS